MHSLSHAPQNVAWPHALSFFIMAAGVTGQTSIRCERGQPARGCLGTQRRTREGHTHYAGTCQLVCLHGAAPTSAPAHILLRGPLPPCPACCAPQVGPNSVATCSRGGTGLVGCPLLNRHNRQS